MRILIVAEHDQDGLRGGTLSAIRFAADLAERTDGQINILIIGEDVGRVAQDAARFAPVLVADAPALQRPTADRYAAVIADVVRRHECDLVAAASSSFSKDVIGRAGGLLGGAMASEVVGHQLVDGELQLRRPMYAGAVMATVVIQGSPLVITVRASSYAPAVPGAAQFEIAAVAVHELTLPALSEIEREDTTVSERPDVTEANIVVSGGRALKTREDFERIVGGLADVLHGATGSSRALVDAGITPNEFQVGQTGKIIAPELYIALGLSGAVQHMAGMKNSKIIVAINTDPDAPIFEMADYGLQGDIYEVVPELIEKLRLLCC